MTDDTIPTNPPAAGCNGGSPSFLARLDAARSWLPVCSINGCGVILYNPESAELGSCFLCQRQYMPPDEQP